MVRIKRDMRQFLASEGRATLTNYNEIKKSYKYTDEMLISMLFSYNIIQFFDQFHLCISIHFTIPPQIVIDFILFSL